MKIAFITTYDRKGGAAQSSWRTALALRKAGVAVKVVVQQQGASENFVVPTNHGWKKIRSFINEYWDRLSYVIHAPERSLWFRYSIGKVGQDISQLKAIQEADVLHLHWINKGYLSVQSLEKLAALGKPIIWSLHDMWAFTGGCHYAGACDHFEKECGDCWYLKSSHPKDLSQQMWLRKKAFYDQVNWTMVTSSKWLGKVAERSSLLKKQNIRSIPTPVEIDLFRPADQTQVRKKRNLPLDKKLLLFVAMNVAEERKGFKYLQESLDLLYAEDPSRKETMEILVLGKATEEQLSVLPFKVNHLGFLSQASQIAEAYTACDVFIMPSLEDNLPNVVLESLACGRPVVAFETGGIPEMVEHLKSGYIARFKDSKDLAQGILHSLDEKHWDNFAQNARTRILEHFSDEIISDQYIKLYQSLLEGKQ